MGDLTLYTGLKKCCVDTLKKLDEKQSTAATAKTLVAIGPLLPMLCYKPPDVALEWVAHKVGELAGEHKAGSSLPDKPDDALDKLLCETCAKICELHALDHANQGENTVARFWCSVADLYDSNHSAGRKSTVEARAKAALDLQRRRQERDRKQSEAFKFADKWYKDMIDGGEDPEAATRKVNEYMESFEKANPVVQE